MTENKQLTPEAIAAFIEENLPAAATRAYLTAGNWEDDWQCPQDGLQHIYREGREWHQEWMSFPVFAVINGVLHSGVYKNYGAGDPSELDGWTKVETESDFNLSYTYHQEQRDASEYIAWVLEHGEDPLWYFSVAQVGSETIADFAVRIELDAEIQEAWVTRLDGEPITDAQGAAVSLRKVVERWSVVNDEIGATYAFVAEMDTDNDGVIEYSFGAITYEVPKAHADYVAQLTTAAKNRYAILNHLTLDKI